MKIEPVRGTRDFYPEDKFVQNYIFDIWKKVCEKYGYQDYDGPMLEPAKLWQMKSGAEIPEQMYTLKDKSDRILAVRPELTPTLARMVAAKQREMAKPIRLYSIARCWRYEAPQSGRLREFFQLNVDILGNESMQLDAEVIANAVDIAKAFGLTEKDFYVRLGNRKLIQSLILSTGVSNDKLQEVSRLIDKIDKIGEKEFISECRKISADGQKILDALKMPIEKIRLDDEKGKEGLAEIKELVKFLKFYSIEKYVEVDLTIMRGFDYYTSTVFELFDRSKEHRAIAGGGRYDDLVSDFGGERLPGIGYGMGDVVLELFLRSKNRMPKYESKTDYFIAVMDDSVIDYAISVANELRKKHNVVIEVMGRQLKKQIEYAKKIGAKKLIVIGENEKKSKKWEEKNL
jgi:histidyl-tRNA synthetase